MERTKTPGIFKRNGRYVAVVGYRDGFGHKRQKWISARTLTAIKDARRTLQGEIEKGIKPDASRMTVAELSGLYLADVRSRLRPASVRHYESVLRNRIVPALGDLKLRDVNRYHLRELYDSIDSPSLRLRCHSTCSAMFTYAVRDLGLLVVNPCAAVRRPRYTAPEAKHLDPAESKRMLEAAVGDPIEPAIVLGLAGGLRIAEAVAVRWGDLEDDMLTVRRSWWGETKSGRIRSLTLPASARDALKRCKRAQAESLLSVGIRQGPETHMVADPIGRPMGLGTFKNRFAEFCTRHRFEVSFHSLRHSNAIAMLVAGVDPKTAASRLGHSNPALLFQTYSHYIRSADKAAADRLEGMLGG